MSDTHDGKFFQQIHTPNATPKEITKVYDEWSSTYDEHLSSRDYKAPTIVAEAAAEYFPTNREAVTILDVCAGTGKVGQELQKRGFTQIDAIDPAQAMLDEAAKKGVYRRIICDYVTDTPLDIPADTYDAITISHGMHYGALPYDALHELIRLVRPGGVICNATRPAVLSDMELYKDKFSKLVDKLETEGKLKLLKKSGYAQAYVDQHGSPIEGIIFVHVVC